MKRLVLILSLFLFGHTALSQGWLPWQNNPTDSLHVLQETSVAALAEEDILTIAYSTLNGVRVQQYNGIFWSNLPQPYTQLSFSDLPLELIRYQGDLYLLTRTHLRRLNGNSWTQITTGAYSDIEEYNGQLVFGGGSTISTVNLTTYDGISLGQIPSTPTGIDSIGDIHVYNNELYIAGGGNVSGGISGLINYDGSTWSDAAHNLSLGSNYNWVGLQVFDMNSKLYLLDPAGINEVRNDSIVQVVQQYFTPSSQSTRWNRSEIAVHNDSAYLGTRYFTRNAGLSIFDGSSVTQLTGSPTVVNDVVEFKGERLAIRRDSVFNGVRAIVWIFDQNAASLSFNVYWDKNADCTFDISDSLINKHFISLQGGQTLYSPIEKSRVINLAPGTYSLDSVYGYTSFTKYLIPSCNWPQSFSLSAQQIDTLEFPLSLQQVNDVSVKIKAYRGWGSRHGFTERYEAVVRNLGGNTMSNLNLTVNHHSDLAFVSSTPTPGSSTSSSLEWIIPQIEPLEERKFIFDLEIAPFKFSVGDSLPFSTQVTASNDINLSDNQDSLKVIIVAALDPNDKQASAETILPGTERIDYHIRFQNVGTDTAFKVTLVDTLDMTLPLTKIIINSASHPYQFSVDGNMIIWEFDNIMLPDSSVDYLGSMGYVNFSAGINPSLGVGDTIDNDAEIYFDYQPPVHTNHAKTAIVKWVSNPEVPYAKSLLEIYPNPAVNYIHISNKGNHEMKVSVIDQIGRQIEEITVAGESETSYNIQKLSDGIYFLKSENQVFKLIVK